MQSTPSFPTLIIDGHEDLAWNALEFGRDLRQSALLTRQQEIDTPIPSAVGSRLTGLPQWQAGGVGIIFATIFTLHARYKPYGKNVTVYETPKQAADQAQLQLNYYSHIVQEEPHLHLILNQKDLTSLLEIRQIEANQAKDIGFVLLMEGADPIIQPSNLIDWYQSGIRIIGPAWKSTRYTAGTSEPGGLTLMGKDLLRAMAKQHIILDLSHLAEQAYFESIDSFSGTLIASHSNPRAFCPSDRGLSDEMILALARRQGVMGIVLYNEFLKPGWQTGDDRAEVPLSTIVEIIDHIAQLTSSATHAALGSDFDGGFGLESIPEGMDSIADLNLIGEELEKKGFKTKDIQSVMGDNWLRILRKALPE